MIYLFCGSPRLSIPMKIVVDTLIILIHLYVILFHPVSRIQENIDFCLDWNNLIKYWLTFILNVNLLLYILRGWEKQSCRPKLTWFSRNEEQIQNLCFPMIHICQFHIEYNEWKIITSVIFSEGFHRWFTQWNIWTKLENEMFFIQRRFKYEFFVSEYWDMDVIQQKPANSIIQKNSKYLWGYKCEESFNIYIIKNKTTR